MRFDDYLRHQRDMARMLEHYKAGQPSSLDAEDGQHLLAPFAC